jgi:hypothetical protein
MARAKSTEEKAGERVMIYNPADYFSKKEPGEHQFEYRRRGFADLSRRVTQSHRGVPDTAPRTTADSLCRNCGLRRDQHGRKKNPFRACIRFVSPFARIRRPSARKATMTTPSNSEGETTMEETRQRVLLKRPITAPPDFGFHRNVDEAADQAFQCWRLLLEEKSVGEIAQLTRLSPQFIAALADRFF